MHISEGLLPFNWALILVYSHFAVLGVRVIPPEKERRPGPVLQALNGTPGGRGLYHLLYAHTGADGRHLFPPLWDGHLRDPVRAVSEYPDYLRGPADSGPVPGPWRINHLGSQYLFHGGGRFLDRVFDF